MKLFYTFVRINQNAENNIEWNVFIKYVSDKRHL